MVAASSEAPGLKLQIDPDEDGQADEDIPRSKPKDRQDALAPGPRGPGAPGTLCIRCGSPFPSGHVYAGVCSLPISRMPDTIEATPTLSC